MSEKAKTYTIKSSSEKIIAILDKNDIDEALKEWAIAKAYMNKRLTDAAAKFSDKSSELASAVDRL